MITSTNTANYRALFDAAYKKLQDYHLLDNYKDITGITSLEEYFYFLPELAKKLAEQPNEDVGTFMRIPLNEPHFIINTNTRSITVPEEFNKNGIGVIGDQIAETLIFEVDRFFDTTDLNETVIYIEWINAAGESGLSYGIWKTASDEKIIFGWALDDTITAPTNKGDGGKIEFAVRFFAKSIDENTNDLAYSLSTLPQTINVKKTLNFDVLNIDAPVDLSDMLIKRLQPSKITESTDPAQAPTFKLQPEEDTVDLNIDGVYIFKSQAYSTDSGVISYKLFKDNKEFSTNLLNNGFAKTDDYESTNPVDTYYELVFDESGKPTYKPYLNTSIPNPNETIFEKFGQFEITTAGNYYVQATNTKGINTASRNTKTVTIPYPVMPEISDDFISSYQADEGEYVTLSVTATVTDGGVLTYQWQKQENGKYVSIEGATDSKYDSAVVENWYNVIVTNTRNNATISNDVTPDIHVTARVQPPTLNIPDGAYNDVKAGSELEVKWVRGERTGVVEISLYRVKNTATVGDLAPADLTNDKYDFIESKSGEEGKLSFTINSTGRYFIKATNTRNKFTSDPVYSSDYWAVVQ